MCILLTLTFLPYDDNKYSLRGKKGEGRRKCGQAEEDKRRPINIKLSGCTVIGELADPTHPRL